MKWILGQKLHLENSLSMTAGVYNSASSHYVLENMSCINKHSHKNDSRKERKSNI